MSPRKTPVRPPGIDGENHPALMNLRPNTADEVEAAAAYIDRHVPADDPTRADVLEALGFAGYVGGCWEPHNGHRKTVHRDAVHRRPS